MPGALSFNANDQSSTFGGLWPQPWQSFAPCQPIILDGLVFGAIDPAGLARVQPPVIAMIHHSLGLETGLLPARATFLRANEVAALRRAAHAPGSFKGTSRQATVVLHLANHRFIALLGRRSFAIVLVTPCHLPLIKTFTFATLWPRYP